jgi:hypothetical protein
MKTQAEQLDYRVHLDGVPYEMTNRWGERFAPDLVEAYWVKDAGDQWVLDVVTVSGVGILKRTGEPGKQRRSEWFDTDTKDKMPGELWDLVTTNRPRSAAVV